MEMKVSGWERYFALGTDDFFSVYHSLFASEAGGWVKKGDKIAYKWYHAGCFKIGASLFVVAPIRDKTILQRKPYRQATACSTYRK
jgi:hypothetical protein